MRYRTESHAWRELARRVATRGLLARGLCYEIADLHETHAIDGALARRMEDRVWEQIDAMAETHGEFAFPAGDAAVRVLAALFLAHECDDEAAQAVGRAA